MTRMAVTRRLLIGLAVGVAATGALVGCSHGTEPKDPTPSVSPVQPGSLGYRDVDPRDVPNEAAGFVGDISGEEIVYRSADGTKTITVGRGSNRVIGVDFWESGYEEATRYRIGNGKGVCGLREGKVSCMVQTEAFADVMLKTEGVSLEELKAPAEEIARALLEATR